MLFALSLVSDELPSACASGCLKLSSSSETLLVEDEGLTSAAVISSLGGRWEAHGSSDSPTNKEEWYSLNTSALIDYF